MMGDTMYFTGYHGTSRANGNNIIKTKCFDVSNSDTEWLGSGIYFYCEYSDALACSGDRTVLHTIIYVDDNEYIDLDSENGKKIFNAVETKIDTRFKYLVSGNAQENQCVIANMIWQEFEYIKLLIASFAIKPSKIKTLIDGRKKRREFCIRDNSAIKSIQIIEDVI